MAPCHAGGKVREIKIGTLLYALHFIRAVFPEAFSGLLLELTSWNSRTFLLVQGNEMAMIGSDQS